MTFRRSSVYRDLSDLVDRKVEHILQLERRLLEKDARIAELEREVSRLLQAESAA